MKCPGCDRELQRREHAQTMPVNGSRIRPRSFCDECCRAHPWTPGSAASLDRLVKGTTDPYEIARLAGLATDQ